MTTETNQTADGMISTRNLLEPIFMKTVYVGVIAPFLFAYLGARNPSGAVCRASTMAGQQIGVDLANLAGAIRTGAGSSRPRARCELRLPLRRAVDLAGYLRDWLSHSARKTKARDTSDFSQRDRTIHHGVSIRDIVARIGSDKDHKSIVRLPA